MPRLKKLLILASVNSAIARISFNLVLSEHCIIARPFVSKLAFGFQIHGCFFLVQAGPFSLRVIKAIRRAAGPTEVTPNCTRCQEASSPSLFRFDTVFLNLPKARAEGCHEETYHRQSEEGWYIRECAPLPALQPLGGWNNYLSQQGFSSACISQP